MSIKPITFNLAAAVVAQDPGQSWGFSFLSEELIAKIFSLLIDPEDQKCLKLTCQAFSRISKDERVQEQRKVNHLFTSFDFRNALTALASHICSPGATIDSIKNSAKLFHRSFKASTLVIMDWSDKTNAQRAEKILRKVCTPPNELLTLSCSELATLFSRDKFRKVVEENDINIFNPECFFKNVKLIQKAHSELPLETIEKELFQEAVAHFNEKISERTKQELEALVIKLLKEPGHSAIVLELMENTFNPYVNTRHQNALPDNNARNLMSFALCICFYRNLLKDKRILEAPDAALLEEKIKLRIQTFFAAATNQFSEACYSDIPITTPFNKRLKLLRLLFPNVPSAFTKGAYISLISLHLTDKAILFLKLTESALLEAKANPALVRTEVVEYLIKKKCAKLEKLQKNCLKRNFPSCTTPAEAEQLLKETESAVLSLHKSDERLDRANQFYLNLKTKLMQINSISKQIDILQKKPIDEFAKEEEMAVENETKKGMQELVDSVTLLRQIIPHEELS